MLYDYNTTNYYVVYFQTLIWFYPSLNSNSVTTRTLQLATLVAEVKFASAYHWIASFSSLDPKVALRTLFEFGIFHEIEEKFVVFGSIVLFVELELFTCDSWMERQSALKTIAFLTQFALIVSLTPFVVVRSPIDCSFAIRCWTPDKVLIGINAHG